jgi:hypothetical protein
VSKNFYKILIIVSITAIIFLRISNLGYSDYIDDEHSSFLTFKQTKGPLYDYLMNMRKGPLQNVVALLPYLFTGDFTNTFAERLPFAVFNLLALIVFYKVLKTDLNNNRIAFISTVFLGVNGFIVAFGRIVQYQSLNLFFSFLSLLFFIYFRDKRNIFWSLLGTLSLVMSLYAHWDVIFILVPIVGVLAEYFLNKSVDFKKKFIVALLNLLLFAITVLPYFGPYLIYQSNSVSNQGYLTRRFGFNESKDLTFKFLYELYNPLLSWWIYSILAIASTLWMIFSSKILSSVINKVKIVKNVNPFPKPYYKYVLWLILSLLYYMFFMSKPGTHVYNIVIPMIIVSAFTLDYIANLLISNLQRNVYICTLAFFFIFLWLQSYLIFVEHKTEYPWQKEKILFSEFPTSLPDKPLPLFGFPKKRFWKEINAFILEENKRLGINAGYVTNEDISHTRFYMDIENNANNTFYYAVVKRPYTFVDDWKARTYKNKAKLKEFFDENGSAVARVYLVQANSDKSNVY